ncbi:MAG TPA: PQQ-dependent sugar dehydrogenase [Anaerolineaceae bacterium]
MKIASMRRARRSRGLAALILICLVISACAAANNPGGSAPANGAATLPAQAAGVSTAPADAPAPASQPTNGLSLPLVLSNPAATSAPTAVPLFPDPQSLQWKEITPSLGGPVGIDHAADGSGRLFVLVRSGVIRVIQHGQLADAPFLDLTSRVTSHGSEQGLLGIAFHPNFRQNGFFYVDYTDVNGDTVIARYHAAPGAATADANSGQVVLHIQQPYPNHNGGQLAFGPDGFLYIGMGDGGSEGDPQNYGQSTQTLLGKLLRIDVDHGNPYSIPPDNPFVKGGGRPEIWAYGLRNPWRFSFDSQTHDLYIADVGQDQYEEIDFLPAGSPGGTNFGWRLREGFHQYGGAAPSGVTLTDPVYEYDHSQGCAVTGGYVYRGQALPAWRGIYFFADYCSGIVWGLVRGSGGKWTGQQLFQTGLAITSFGTDEQGELYLADQRGGIYELAAR